VLEVFLAPHAEGRRSAGGTSEVRHLHATGTEGEWRVRLLPAGMEVGRGHGKGAAASDRSRLEPFRPSLMAIEQRQRPVAEDDTRRQTGAA
jgi:hypothetical protein